jgi:hypothetical protein
MHKRVVQSDMFSAIRLYVEWLLLIRFSQLFQVQMEKSMPGINAR